MARAAKPAKGKTTSAAPAGPGRSLVWLQGLLCGVLTACTPATALLLAVLLAPCVAAVAFDRAPGRPVARTMLLFGLSTTVLPVIALWNAGHTTDAALALATDPQTLALAWVAAGGGWLLTELLPLVTRLAIESATIARRSRLRATRDRCAADWGLPSTGSE